MQPAMSSSTRISKHRRRPSRQPLSRTKITDCRRRVYVQLLLSGRSMPRTQRHYLRPRSRALHESYPSRENEKRQGRHKENRLTYAELLTRIKITCHQYNLPTFGKSHVHQLPRPKSRLQGSSRRSGVLAFDRPVIGSCDREEM